MQPRSAARQGVGASRAPAPCDAKQRLPGHTHPVCRHHSRQVHLGTGLAHSPSARHPAAQRRRPPAAPASLSAPWHPQRDQTCWRHPAQGAKGGERAEHTNHARHHRLGALTSQSPTAVVLSLDWEFERQTPESRAHTGSAAYVGTQSIGHQQGQDHAHSKHCDHKAEDSAARSARGSSGGQAATRASSTVNMLIGSAKLTPCHGVIHLAGFLGTGRCELLSAAAAGSTSFSLSRQLTTSYDKHWWPRLPPFLQVPIWRPCQARARQT